MMQIINKRTMRVTMEDTTNKINSARENMPSKLTNSSITQITIMTNTRIIKTKKAAKIITIMKSMLKILIHRYHKSFLRVILTILTAKLNHKSKASRVISNNRNRQMIKMIIRSRLFLCNNKK